MFDIVYRNTGTLKVRYAHKILKDMVMILPKRHFFIIAIVCFLSLIPGQSFSFTDQTTSERIIKENKQFIEFINICLSNFARDKKDDFLKSYEKHFNGEVAFLQSDYQQIQ